ncbi:MAG: hypothetical protein U9O94_03085 [Nanoarchaeota archaeon]|nr:hypothetical protein [Nanoarchaeota archaeon]
MAKEYPIRHTDMLALGLIILGVLMRFFNKDKWGKYVIFIGLGVFLITGIIRIIKKKE